MKEITFPVTTKQDRGVSIAERLTRSNFVLFYRKLREQYGLTLSEATIREINLCFRLTGEAWVILMQQQRRA